MSSDSLERFKKRQKLKNSITVSNNVIKDSEVNEFLNSNCDNDKVASVYKKTEEFYNTNVSQAEAEAFLIRFKKEFNQARFNQLVTDCKKDVINSIVTPFGIGHIVAAYDKAGGNVDTVHNVRDGVYATEQEQQKYNGRENYSGNKRLKKDYHSKHKNYKDKSNLYKEQQENGQLKDAYNGKTFSKDDNVQVEHVISTEEIHNDAGRILSEQDGTQLANTDSNLKPVIQNVNGSKQNDTATEFIARVTKNKEKIKALEVKDNLTPEEKQGLERLKRVTDIDEEKVKNLDIEARKEYNSKINKTYYTSGKFAKNTVISGAKEGAKMGMQQALGLVITEFFTAVFDEIIDIYKNGYSTDFEDDRFFSVLKERLKRIALKIKDKWKDAAMAFKDGFISGFISNLVTVVINAFVTTGKRVVRIIREGIYSLFKAAKVLIFPPENMTYEEALHEAKKLLATGLIVSLGVIVEQYIDTLIKGTAVLEPFSDILTTVFVGAITGLAITMTVYYIDKKKNDKDALQMLITQTDTSFDNIDSMLSTARKIDVHENSNLIARPLYLKS